MSRKAFLVVLATVAALLCFTCAGRADTYSGRCNVRFHAEATMHSFDGDITNVPLAVVCETNEQGAALLSTRLEIGPRQLTTHSAGRDANMYKMFQEDLFPKLVVAVSNAPLAAANISGQAHTPGVLATRLIFCGIAKEIRSVTSNPQAVAEGWEFDLDTDISLKDFGLKAPSAMLGAITVHDIVKVKTHVKLQKEPP